MASYNHAEFISAAIESVLAQDHSNWELLIADDASTDNTLEVLSRFEDPRIEVFSFDINRRVHMRNFAIGRSSGRYVAFLNSDDVFQPSKLSRQVARLESAPELAAVFTGVQAIDAAGDAITNHPLVDVFDVPNRGRHEWLRYFFLHGNRLCLPSAMVRRTAFDAVGLFDPLLVQVSDLDLWVRLCLFSEVEILPEKLTAMRVLGGNANLSAPSAGTTNRTFFEHCRVLRRYLEDEAILQAGEIFPDLEELVPEPKGVWWRYLISQLACDQPYAPVRLFGFQALQRLLEDPDVASEIEYGNPRMMRNFVLAEFSSAVVSEAPGTFWKVYLPDKDGAYCEERSHTFFRSLDRQTLILSVPNPGVKGRLRIDPGDFPIAFTLRGFRLYDQQSGGLVWELDLNKADLEIEVGEGAKFEKDTNGWVFQGDLEDPQMYLPILDLQSLACAWLDLEIDLTPVERAKSWSTAGAPYQP